MEKSEKLNHRQASFCIQFVKRAKSLQSGVEFYDQ